METYEPMQPKRGSTNILERSGLIGYIFEPKFDGIRVLIYKDKDNIALFNQVKKDIIALFPEFLDLSAFIKSKSCVLDAEIVVLNNSKVPDQSLLQEREQAKSAHEIKFKSKKIPASIFVFDILEKDEISLVQEPLRKRKMILKGMILNGPNINIVPYTMHGKDLWAQVEKQKLPGMMAKESGSRYMQRNNWSWLEINKKPMTDAVIAGIEHKKESNKNKTKNTEKIDSIYLALYDPKIDNFKYAGKIEEKDLEKSQIKIIKHLMQKSLTDKPIINIETMKDLNSISSSDTSIKWLEPSIVARIKFKEIINGQLIMPKIARIRLDKYPRECKIE